MIGMMNIEQIGLEHDLTLTPTHISALTVTSRISSLVLFFV